MNINFLGKDIIGGEQVFFRYTRWLIYILVFSVPLFFLPWTSEVLEFNKHFLIFVFSAAALTLYLVQVVRSGKLTFKKNPLNYPILIFIGAIILVSLFSDFKYQSIFGGFGAGFYESLLSAIAFAVLFFVVLNLFGQNSGSAKTDALKLFNIFSFSLFIVLVLAILNLFGVPVFKFFGISQNFFNTSGTLNSLGVLAAVLLVFSISKPSFDGGGQYFGYLRPFFIALSLFFLLILNWWVLWVIAITGLVFTVIIGSMRDWRISTYFWPLIIIMAAVLLILLDFNLSSILGLNMPIEISPSFSTSFDIASQTLMKDPLFGTGPENFARAYELYKPDSINNTDFWNVKFSEASSEMFSMLVSYGLVGFAALAFLLFAAFRLGFRNQEFFPVFGTFIAAWALYPYNITIGFGFWILLSILALSSSKNEEIFVDLEKSPRHSLITSVCFVCVLILTLVGAYFAVVRYAANIKYVKALTLQSDSERQTRLLVEAVNLSKNEDLYSRVLANFLVARINRGLENLKTAKSVEERQAILSQIQNYSATAINLGIQTTDRNKTNSVNWFSRALVYEGLINVVDGSDQWAIRMYEEYAKVSPKDPEPYLRIANIYLSVAEAVRLNSQVPPNQVIAFFKSAEENYKKALGLKPNYVLAIYNLGVVYERQGRVKDSINQLEILKSANPLDANLALQLSLLYYRDNQKSKSFSEVQRAILIFPNFSNARWYLALLLEERGELNAALEQLYKIRELNEDNKLLEGKIKELKAGKRSLPPEKVTGFKPLETKSRAQ
ncbi:MAG: tetratricopeptide repeat protein [Patescibacteria group bacterium]